MFCVCPSFQNLEATRVRTVGEGTLYHAVLACIAKSRTIRHIKNEYKIRTLEEIPAISGLLSTSTVAYGQAKLYWKGLNSPYSSICPEGRSVMVKKQGNFVH